MITLSDARSTRMLDVIAVDCPYCGGVDDLRFGCWHCAGLGRVPQMVEYPKPTISRQDLRNAVVGFFFMFALGALLLAWKMGVL